MSHPILDSHAPRILFIRHHVGPNNAITLGGSSPFVSPHHHEDDEVAHSGVSRTTFGDEHPDTLNGMNNNFAFKSHDTRRRSIVASEAIDVTTAVANPQTLAVTKYADMSLELLAFLHAHHSPPLAAARCVRDDIVGNDYIILWFHPGAPLKGDAYPLQVAYVRCRSTPCLTTQHDQ